MNVYRGKLDYGQITSIPPVEMIKQLKFILTRLGIQNKTVNHPSTFYLND
jgi:hypothetical protein